MHQKKFGRAEFCGSKRIDRYKEKKEIFIMSKLGNKKNSKDAKQKQMAQQLAALAKKNEKKKTGK